MTSRPRRTPRPVRLWRLARLLVHLLLGGLIAGLVFPFVSNRTELRIIQRWSRRLLAILGVRLHVHGRMPGGQAPTLVVSNHVSWLDIWVIHAVTPVRFVAKSDIRAWPGMGWLAARAGTIFIQRTRRRDTARINDAIAGVLARHERVGLFPEGTTTEGGKVLPFHASLFQPAAAAGARIVTAAIRYPGRDGGPNLDASYAGDRSLPESLRLILAQPALHAELTFAGVIEPDGQTRRELADRARELIVSALFPHAATGTPPAPPAGHPAATH